jgi:ribonuclease BN (tRNA processing enzyme)
MRATVRGCRGSVASPGAATVRYGGNTSCVEVRPKEGPLIVLDAGTGIRRLGATCDRDGVREVHLVLTHLHLDHVEGFAFFSPLWSSDIELHVWGPASPAASLSERIARYLSPPLFPLGLQDVLAPITFRDVPDNDWEIGTVRLRAEPVVHPGPTVGYRLEENGRSLRIYRIMSPRSLATWAREPPTGSRDSPWRTESKCSYTTPNSPRRNIEPRSAGVIRASQTPSRSLCVPGFTTSSCFITIPNGRTTILSIWSIMRAISGAGTATGQLSALKGWKSSFEVASQAPNDSVGSAWL